MPSKSLEKHKDRIYALKLTQRRLQRYNNIEIQIRAPKGLIITNHSFCRDEKFRVFEKQRKLTNGSEDTTGGHP
jgi:hypothetical protein